MKEDEEKLKKGKAGTMSFVYQKALITTFHPSFLTIQFPLLIHSTRTQIPKVILYIKTGFKHLLILVYKKNRLGFGMTNLINKH